MSTRTVIGGLGAAVGFLIGGPQGAYYGWALGSVVGNAVDPQTIKGPRVGEISEQTSKEGGPIPIVYARSPPMTGNIIATSEPRIVKKKKRQGKGGPKVETETVLRTYAIGVCEGVVNFLRVWRNGQIVYDVSNNENYHDASGRPLADLLRRVIENNDAWTERARFYTGAYDQNPDPDLEAIFGVGSTAAHRGIAYMVVVDDDLTDTRGAIPQYVFQVDTGAGGEAVIVYEAGVHEWEKPIGLLSIDFEVLAAGGGGASGSHAIANGNARGGKGGGGGEYRSGSIDAADLEDTEVVTVGFGGSGGGPVLSGNTNATSGVSGEDSSFGAHVLAKGGEGGSYAGGPGSEGGTGGFGGTGEAGGEGSAQPLDPPNVPGGSTSKSGPGGGGGGGHATGPDRHMPGAPGGSSDNATGGGGGPAGTTTAIGSIGQAGGDSDLGAGGGGGGGGTANYGAGPGNRIGGDGARGGRHGAGGGGGGAGLSDGPSGGGGPGGDGLIIIRQTFDDFVAPLADVVSDICARANLPAELIDVSQLTGSVRGYAITNTYPAMEALQALGQIFLFDCVSVDGKVTFVPRGANTVATITTAELCADDEDREQTKRADPIQVPRVLNLNYHDVDGQLSTDKQTSERDGDRRAVGEAQLETAVLMTADEAARVVRINHKVMVEDQAGEYTFALPDKYIGLVASDAIFFQDEGATVRLRLTRVDTFDGYQEYTALRDRQSAYVSNVEGYPASPGQFPASQSVGPTLLRLLDIPIQVDSDDGKGLVLYIAVAGTDEAWQGALVELSYDGGANYVDSETVEVSATMGLLLDDLPAHPSAYPDVTNTLRVELQTPNGELEAVDLAALLNDQNRAVVGDEVLQFAGADEVSPGVWELTTLLRGRQDTEAAAHVTGNRFTLLDSYAVLPMSITDLGRVLTFRATSIGASTDTGTVVAITYTGKSQTERHVGYLAARRDGSDLVVEWQGVGRLGAGAHVAHGARFTGYRVTIDDGTNPAIVVDTTAQTITQGVGALSSPLTVTVQQVNALTGAGPETTVEIV